MGKDIKTKNQQNLEKKFEKQLEKLKKRWDMLFKRREEKYVIELLSKTWTKMFLTSELKKFYERKVNL